MYPVGLLFGLGFDTATEVGLLVLAGGAAAFALPWYAILTLPVLFAAGMSLLDTIDGCFMNFAYGWAFSKPVRKVYYNITITGLSVAVALVIGTIELVSILADQLGITSGPLAAVAGLDLNHVGYAIVGLFVATWVVALAVWRFAGIEEKWSDATCSPERRAAGPGPVPLVGSPGRAAPIGRGRPGVGPADRRAPRPDGPGSSRAPRGPGAHRRCRSSAGTGRPASAATRC